MIGTNKPLYRSKFNDFCQNFLSPPATTSTKYSITLVIRLFPCIQNKEIWRFEKPSWGDYIRPLPSILVITPPFRYKATYDHITERSFEIRLKILYFNLSFLLLQTWKNSNFTWILYCMVQFNLESNYSPKFTIYPFRYKAPMALQRNGSPTFSKQRRRKWWLYKAIALHLL